MKKFSISLFIIILILSVHSFLFAQEGNEITLTVDFSPLEITPSGEYYSLYMKDTWNYGAPGEPVIPVKTVKILIPFGSKENEVYVDLGEKINIQGSYLIKPGQEPVPLSYKGPVQLTSPDARIYTSERSYPSKIFSEPVVQFKNGSRILVINLYPVHYVPLEGKISYYKKMTVHVSLESEIKSLDLSESLKWRGSPSDIRNIKNLVDNPGTIETYPSRLPVSSGDSRGVAPGDYKYVIITSAALAGAAGPNNFQALRDAKIARGITATIMTVEDIYNDADYNDVDAQAEIRNFIIDAHDTWGTEYILLGGDADGDNVGGESEAPIVPVRELWAMVYDFDEGDNIPSDMYYSCLDGDFDADGDGRYGEYPQDNPDFFVDVHVGRACVDSAAELSNFVAKTLHYEGTVDNYLSTAYMVGELLNSSPLTWGGDYKDEVKDGSSANGYTTVGFPTDVITTSTLYDRDAIWPKADIIDIIDNDTPHLINHAGHAANTYLMKMVNAEVDALTNTEYFIGHSQGCYAGAFDNWEAVNAYIASDCILEHFTTEANGAVAFVGNSRYGWYNPGGTNGPSQRFDRQFWDALFGEDIFELGKMNSDSKEDNAGYMNSSAYGRWCAYALNLFGDPELSVHFATSEGVVRLDRDYYPVPATVNVTVWDSDLDLDPNNPDSTTVGFTSDTEAGAEVVSLNETGDSTGVFIGSIDLEVGTASADGILQVQDEDTITGTYDDGGTPVADTAIISLLSAPTSLTATAGGTYVFLNWDTVQDSVLEGYSVYRSTSLTGTKTKVSGTKLVETNSFQDIYLSSNTTYYYWVTAEDIYGKETGYSDSVEITTTTESETGGNGDDGSSSSSSSSSDGVGTLAGCFIATACYGTPMAEEVRILSNFRDEYLLTNSLGRFFVRTYYKVSPQIASFISGHPPLKKLVRGCLKPVVKVTDKILQR